MLACVYAVAVLAFDLVAGHGGMFTLGSSGLMAFGGYAYAMLTSRSGLPAAAAIVSSMIVAGGVAFVAALCLSRLSGDLFALATFGLHRIAKDCSTNLESWTGGAMGIRGVAIPFGMNSRTDATLIVGTIAVLFTWMVCRRVTDSLFGLQLHCVRDDPVAASATGISPYWIRTTTFAIHGGFMGLAGAILVAQQGAVSPDVFAFDLGLAVVSMGIIGGLATWRGALAGVILVMLTSESIKCVGTSTLAGGTARILVDTILLLFLALRPEGLFGSYFHRKRKPGTTE